MMLKKYQNSPIPPLNPSYQATTFHSPIFHSLLKLPKTDSKYIYSPVNLKERLDLVSRADDNGDGVLEARAGEHKTVADIKGHNDYEAQYGEESTTGRSKS